MAKLFVKVITPLAELLRREEGLHYIYRDSTSSTRVTKDKRQVKNSSEIRVGNAYLRRNDNGGLVELLVVQSIDRFYHNFVSVVPETGEQKTYYFRDLGIVPYSDGRWHINNYLLPKKKERL